MGIRFICPNGHKLNVKTFLAGKRGICPHCDAKFIIPASSGGRSVAVDDEAESEAVVAPPVPSSSLPIPETTQADVWYVRPAKGDERYGPASSEEMRTWIAEGRIPADSWVWRTGWSEWKFGSEALDDLKTPAAEAPGISNLATPSTKLEIHTAADLASKKLRRKSPRSRRLQAQKLTVALGVLVLLLSLGVAVVLSIQ